ncbi:heme o synthase [Planctomycetota bacterium]|nr:heme o synthase [Planctomycetota bacterium]
MTAKLTLNPWQKRAHKLAWMTAGLTLFLIVVGAMVTTTKAGDTNPDWSLSFWQWFETWWNSTGGRAWEDGHRVIGTTVGFFAIATAFAVWKGERNSPRRWLGLIVVIALMLQGVIGGLRVLVVSHPEFRDNVLHLTGGGADVEARRAIMAMFHGVIGQISFALLSIMVLVTSRQWISKITPKPSINGLSTRKLSRFVVFAAVLQLILGTIVRQTGHHVMWHVAGAFTVTFSIIWLVMRVFRYHSEVVAVRRTTSVVGFLLILQVFLGIVPWMLTQGQFDSPTPLSLVAILRSTHVTVGALLLIAVTVQLIWIHRLIQDAEPGTEPVQYNKFQDYMMLTKARLSGLVLFTVAAGYFIGSPESADFAKLLPTMFACTLTAAGVAALNQYIERDADAKMKRTKMRPIPAGRMSAKEGLLFGIGTSIAGIALQTYVGWVTALLLTATAVTYVFIYTPLKSRTTANTLVGAIPGALPPVIGYVAATGSVSPNSFLLFSIVFVWQLPHFWSIAWLYREDYREGGMKMLGANEGDNRMLSRQIAIWCSALVLTSLFPFIFGMAGRVYFVSAVLLGAGFMLLGLINVVRASALTNRGVFLGSLIYLPLLLLALFLDLRW